jgi:hypothetical protein
LSIFVGPGTNFGFSSAFGESDFLIHALSIFVGTGFAFSAALVSSYCFDSQELSIFAGPGTNFGFS